MAIQPGKTSPWTGKRLLKWFSILYVVLLGLSHLVRLGQSDFNPRPDQTWVSLPEMDHQSATGNLVNLSFVDSGGDGPVILLLHGSPASSSFMMRMHADLSGDGRFRVITPDLPGFGGSSRRLVDYSISSHASYIVALMDSLRIEKAHLVGYSMSGGVAAELMNLAPSRMSSVVMLAAIGVQKLELLGDYHLNHTLHGMQYGVIWLISEAFPHFGWFDSALLSVPYARNFLDSDQRPLREYLSGFEQPTLLIYGRKDALVSYSTALEHHRIIPQSTLITYDDAGHGIPIQHAEDVSKQILDWTDRVESGLEPFRSTAPASRVTDAARPFDARDLPPLEGFALLLVLVLIALTTLLSEDLASIGAGLMVARGSLEFEMALLAAFIGILTGDVGLHLAGRMLGTRIVTLPPFSWLIDAQRLKRATTWFQREGAKVVIISRFIPGSRFPVFVGSGVLKAPFWKFMGIFLVTTMIWTPLIVGVSTLMGNQILAFWALYESYALFVFLAVIVLLYSFFHLVLPLTNHMGRRRLRSKWKRITGWEFWPPFIFYPPLLVYLAYLALKHRSLTVFTAANPGIPSGGFVGESKSDILDLLSGTPEFVARYTRISSSDTAVADIRDFMAQERLSWPLVLKPDVGERGHGVYFVQSDEEVATFFSAERGVTIAQEYVQGKEYGIFYVRHPSEPRGRIISITKKELISVVGDGVRTLERLILDDPRANCVSKTLQRRHMDDLDTVIGEGQTFQLVDVGTHARGALFLDGSELISGELERVFDYIALPATGFYFGRFDVRVPDEEDLRLGQHFKILELNGVTSEATHIYDPKHSLGYAYKTLAHQWRMAFDIGAENVRRGAKPTGLRKLAGLIYRFKIHPENRPDTAASARV
jgi:pimeloyl-ACP methyl ester carboxylesterase/membrane protein DedA with SNARE-associated domain